MRRTKQEAEETRQLILQAARILFVQKGFAATTLDDIASKAGFTRGAVHWHFKNKFGVLLAIQEVERSPMEELVSRLGIDESLDPLAALSITTQRFFIDLAEIPDRRQLFQVIFREMHNTKFDRGFSKAAHFEQEVRHLIINILKIAEDRNSLSEIWSPESAALALQTMIKGIITGWLYETSSFNLVEEGIPAIKNFLTSLRKS
ncbi:TetR family transcriptional regulator [Microvirga sp. W0021]|uniref:TetR family transcriptional regulator n=1 Tax=Hohaiivirga grylli TaxID=3133970 RepID=A0ABV0BL56_9HYPH